MNFGHRGYTVRHVVRPGAQAATRYDRGEVAPTSCQHVVAAAQSCPVAHGRRVPRDLHVVGMADQADLKKTLDTVESFENEFVAGIEFDARFPIYALRTQLGAELAFRFRTVTSGFT